MPDARAVECVITGLIFEEFIHVIIFLVWFGVLWREKSCGGIIGNDQSRRNAREWKDRERVGTWKENANAGRLGQSRETDRTNPCFVWMDQSNSLA